MRRLPIHRPNFHLTPRTRALGLLSIGLVTASLIGYQIREGNRLGQVYTLPIPGSEFCDGKAGLLTHRFTTNYPGFGVKLEGKIYESRGEKLVWREGTFFEQEYEQTDLTVDDVTLRPIAGGIETSYDCLAPSNDPRRK